MCFVVDEIQELPIPKENGVENIRLDSEEQKDAYTAYLQGDEKFLERFGNEHKKFMAAEDAMERHHHDRVSKVDNLCYDYNFSKEGNSYSMIVITQECFCRYLYNLDYFSK